MSANTARSVKCVLSASEPLSQLTTTHTTWFDQRRKNVNQSPVCGTRSTFVLSAEQAVSNSDSPRPGDKLSCRKPAGSATEQSLSAGYFLNRAILPDPAITGIPGRISRAPVRTRIKGKMDQARRGNAESGLLKGKPREEVGSRENDIKYSL